MKAVIAPLLEELKFLEKDGIVVKLSTGEEVRVYFVLALLLGDNLDIHQLCGLVCIVEFTNINWLTIYK